MTSLTAFDRIIGARVTELIILFIREIRGDELGWENDCEKICFQFARHNDGSYAAAAVYTKSPVYPMYKLHSWKKGMMQIVFGENIYCLNPHLHNYMLPYGEYLDAIGDWLIDMSWIFNTEDGVFYDKRSNRYVMATSFVPIPRRLQHANEYDDLNQAEKAIFFNFFRKHMNEIYRQGTLDFDICMREFDVIIDPDGAFALRFDTDVLDVDWSYSFTDDIGCSSLLKRFSKPLLP